MSAGAESMFLGIKLDVDATGAVRGINQTSQAMDGLKRKAKTNGDKMAQDTQATLSKAGQMGGAALGLGLATAGAGEALRRNVLNPMIEEASNFEVEMSQLKFVSGAVGEELNRLKEFVINVGLETQFSPAEAAQGLRRLRAAGLTTEEAITSLGSALDLATGSAGELGLGKAAETTAAALKKFGPNARSVRHIMDAFADATRRTNLQARDLPIILRSAQTAIGDLKLSPGQFFALTGAMKNMGMTAAQSGQSVNSFGRRMLIVQKQVDKFGKRAKGFAKSEAPEVVAAFDKLGVKFFDSQGTLRDMTTIFGEVTEKIRGVGTEQERLVLMQTLFGSMGKNMVNSLGAMDKAALKGMPTFAELADLLDKNEGASREMAAAFEETHAGMKIFIEGTKQTILILLGETLLPILEKISFAVRFLANSFLTLIQRNPVLAKAFAALVVVTTFVLLTMGSLLLLVGVLAFALGPLISAFAAAGTAEIFMGFATLALETVLLPLLLIVLAVTAAILAFVAVGALMYKAFQSNFGGMADFLKAVSADVRAVWGALGEWFAGDGSILKSTGDDLEERGLGKLFWNIVRIVERLKAVWDGFVTVIGVTIRMLEPAFMFVWAMLLLIGRAVVWVFEKFTGMVASTTIDFWKMLGYVIGTVAVVGVLALAAALVPLIISLALVALKAIIIVGAILLVAGAIIWLVAKLVEWGRLIIGFFMNVGVQLEEIFSSWKERAGSWGQMFIDAFVGGMKLAFPGLTKFFSWGLQNLKDMMPGSDAKVGPLSTLTASGSALISTLEIGMSSAFPSFMASLDAGMGLVADALGLSGDTQEGPLPLSTDGTPLSTAETEPGARGSGARAISIGDITLSVSVLKATEEEATRLSEMVIKQIQEGMINLQETEFS